MTRREWALAAVAAAAGLLIVWGVSPYSQGTARITAGVLLALWGWLVLADDGDAADDESRDA